MPPKKRAKANTLLDALASPGSALSKLLIRRWAWGQFSASEVQVLAAQALADQVSLLESIGVSPSFANTSLQILAGLGAEGTIKGNIRRDLISALGDPALPEPVLIKAEMVITKPQPGESPLQEVDVAMLLPHELMSYLYHSERAEFEKKFLGSSIGALASFWSELEKRGDPRLIDHPMKRQRNWREHSIPIAWHGDGVPTIRAGKAGSKSYEVYSWSGILAKGSSLQTKLYAFGYMADNCASHESMSPVWKRLMWSFAAAATGTWPSHNWEDPPQPFDPRSVEGKRAGQKLANGYFLSLYTLKQDLEHLAREYRMGDYRSANPCALCPCNRFEGDWPMNFNNFSPGATWKKMLYSAEQWRDMFEDPHPLLAEEHMSCHNIEPDEAHCLHLGVGQHVIGSVLWLLVYSCDGVVGGSASDKLDKIWSSVRAEYKQHKVPTQMTNLKLSTFHNPAKFADGYPVLSSKAAECKDLVLPMCRVWEQFMDRREEDHVRVHHLLQQLTDLQKILHDHSSRAILPIAAANRFRNLVHGFLTTYSLLANSADREKICLFNIVPNTSLALPPRGEGDVCESSEVLLPLGRGFCWPYENGRDIVCAWDCPAQHPGQGGGAI